jgi:hypothetical protein
MTKTQEARLNMYDAVNAFCNNNPIIVATIPAFQDTLTDFQSLLDSIHATAQLKADVITGIAEDKKELRLTLCQLSTNLAAVLFAYASSIGNNELKQKANFSASELTRMKDGMLTSVSLNLKGLANDNLASLAPYGITASSITDIDNAISDYQNKISSPRNAVSQRGTYRKTLNGLFKQANLILKNQLDKVAVQFKTDYPDFYETYTNNRIIVDPGTSATQIVGTVTNPLSKSAIAGAVVQLVGEAVSFITDDNGNYTLKPVPAGVHSIKITKEGFADDVIDNISVKLGKTTKIDLAINPAA